MKSRVITIAAGLLLCGAVRAVGAQEVDGLRIAVQVAVGHADRGDRRSTAGLVDAGAIGRTSTFAFSRLTGQCGTGVGPAPVGDMGVGPNGTMQKVYSAWTVQVTPTRRAGEAVTFRVRWTRSRDNGNPSTVGDDTELTLRPGQALTLDLMPQTAGASGSSSGCVVKGLSLGVGVVHSPEPDKDRRLLAVDLWLLEQLPDGRQRSQAVSLRGLYHQPIPFYFDTVTGSSKALDIFGDLQVSPGEPAAEIRITTRSRVIDLEPGAPPPGFPPGVPWPPAPYVGSTTATLHVGPDEVVSVLLPAVGNGTTDAAAFAPRTLSFRIRVHQLR